MALLRLSFAQDSAGLLSLNLWGRSALLTSVLLPPSRKSMESADWGRRQLTASTDTLTAVLAKRALDGLCKMIPFIPAGL